MRDAMWCLMTEEYVWVALRWGLDEEWWSKD